MVGHYGLSGSKDAVKSKVEWLLKKSVFLFGDLDSAVSVRLFFLSSYLLNIFFRLKSSTIRSPLAT